MKRFYLFLVLFTSGILILFIFMEKDDTGSSPPPPADRGRAGGEGLGGSKLPGSLPLSFGADGLKREVQPAAGKPEENPGQKAAGEKAGSASREGSEGVPRSGTGPVEKNIEKKVEIKRGKKETSRKTGPGQAAVWDLTLPVREKVKDASGREQEVVAARIHVGHLRQSEGSNRLPAEDVSFTFYDRTPQERPIAKGTAENAVLFSLGGKRGEVFNARLSRNFVLENNVRVELVGREGEGGGTRLFADFLAIDGETIVSPLAEKEGKDRVRILTEGMEISGRGMRADLGKRTVAFEKETMIKGRRFRIPRIIPGSERRKGEEKESKKSSEVLKVSCRGPFLFKGAVEEKKRKGLEIGGQSMLAGGELSLSGGVIACRGSRRIEAERMFIVFSRNAEDGFDLTSFKAEAPGGGVRIEAPEGTTRCSLLTWRPAEGGAHIVLEGSPSIENLGLPSVEEGAAGIEEPYSLTAREKIVVDVTDEVEGTPGRVEILLLGGGGIRPSGKSFSDKALSVSGEEILISLASEGNEKPGEEAAGYRPERIHITGRARAWMEGTLEADEMILRLERAKGGLRRILTLNGKSSVKQKDFSLEAPVITIQILPDMPIDGGGKRGDFTEVKAGEGFVMRIPLEGFSAGGGEKEKGPQGKITAEGKKRLRLTWPEGANGERKEKTLKRNMQIFGPYTIEMDVGGEDRVFVNGENSLKMGSNLFEGALLTILDLSGALHIEAKREGEEDISLECEEGRITLDQTAWSRPKEKEKKTKEFGPVLGEKRPQTLFSRGTIRRIEARKNVILHYGSSKVTCESVFWNVPEDLLAADGDGDPVIVGMSMMKLSGRRFLLRPAEESWEIVDPDAFFIASASPQ